MMARRLKHLYMHPGIRRSKCIRDLLPLLGELVPQIKFAAAALPEEACSLTPHILLSILKLQSKERLLQSSHSEFDG